jgi:hypothetical protein
MGVWRISPNASTAHHAPGVFSHMYASIVGADVLVVGTWPAPLRTCTRTTTAWVTAKPSTQRAYPHLPRMLHQLAQSARMSPTPARPVSITTCIAETTAGAHALPDANHHPPPWAYMRPTPHLRLVAGGGEEVAQRCGVLVLVHGAVVLAGQLAGIGAARVAAMAVVGQAPVPRGAQGADGLIVGNVGAAQEREGGGVG